MNKRNEKTLEEYQLNDFGKITGAIYNDSELYVIGENNILYVSREEESDGDTVVYLDFSNESKDDILKKNDDYVFINCNSSNSYMTDIDVATLDCNITTTNGSISFNVSVKDEIDEEELGGYIYPLDILKTKISINL